MLKSIEFIDEYRMGDGDLDWQYHDNHGVLVRCRDCMWGRPVRESREYVWCCKPFAPPWASYKADWYCADGKRKEDD